MRFFSRAALIALALFACALVPAAASARGLDAYDVKFESGKQLEQLAQQGFDMTEARRGSTVEIVATTKQARQLRSLGLSPRRKTTGGSTPAPALGSRPARRRVVGHLPARTSTTRTSARSTGRRRASRARRSTRSSRDSRSSTRISSSRSGSGTTINGKPIMAFKVTKNAREVRDGQRPATLYSSTQHAREWLATETGRRLLHLFVENYGGTGPAVDEDGAALDGRDEGRDHPDRQQERAVVPPRRQPGRLRLHLHARAIACGARTCATTTTTGTSRPTPTASTSTATSRRTGTTTKRARRATSGARPTAALARLPRTRPRPS